MFFHEHRWYNSYIFRIFLINSVKTVALLFGWFPVGFWLEF